MGSEKNRQLAEELGDLQQALRAFAPNAWPDKRLPNELTDLIKEVGHLREDVDKGMPKLDEYLEPVPEELRAIMEQLFALLRRAPLTSEVFGNLLASLQVITNLYTNPETSSK